MASRGSYPHPVLDNSDDVSGDFRLSAVNVTPEQEFVDLSFDIFITNAEVKELLRSGDATLRARWRCSATFNAGTLALEVETLPTGALRCSAALDHEDLDGRVDVNVTMIAAKSFSLSLATQHPDYEEATFSLRPGSLIANAGTFSFDARKSFDPMRPPIESCFKFQEKHSKKPYIEIDTSLDEHVVVHIPQEQYAQFMDQSMMPEIQIAMVVLPALVQALVDCAQDDEPDRGGWKGTLRHLVEKHPTISDNPLTQAQAILGDPLATGFKRLALLVHDEEDD